MSKFGQTIRELRLTQHLEIRQAANLLNISPSFLNRIERDKELPHDIELIKQMATLYAVDPDVLIRLYSLNEIQMISLIREKPKVKEILNLIAELQLNDAELDAVKKFIYSQQ